MRILQSALIFAALAGLTSIGCTSSTPLQEETSTETAATSVTLANAKCPIMGYDVDEEVAVEWNGKTIGFCCAECIPTWNDLSEEEKAEKLVEADASDAGQMSTHSPNPS